MASKKKATKKASPINIDPIEMDSNALAIVPSLDSILDPLSIIDDELLTPEDLSLVVKTDVKIKIKPRDRIHYVNGKEFEAEIKMYYDTNEVSSKLGESLTKIANGLAFAPNFNNYSFRDEMVGDAILKMFSALKNKKFRLNSGFSPFSYFTTVAFHAFINRIKKEKKQHEALMQYREKVYGEQMNTVNEDGVAVWLYVEPNDDYNNEE